MVDLIGKVNSPEIKNRDGKQNASRSSGGSGTKPLGRGADSWMPEDSASGSTGTASVINLNIANANIEASKITLEDQETADRVLLTTGDLIRNNPERAEAAQASIPAHIVLSLFQAG